MKISKIYKISLKNLYLKSLDILVIVLFFFTTLQSFYYNKISLSLFPVIGSIGLFLIAILNNLNNIDKRLLSKFIFLFFFLIFFQVLMGIVDFFLEKNLNTFFAIIINLIAIFSIFLIFHKNKDKLDFLLVSVTVLHLFFFYLQVVVWFATDYFIDYVDLLSDDHSVFLSLKGLFLFDQRIPRFTGLFNEPSAYATWFFAIFSLYILTLQRINSIFLLGVLSMLITMSILGLIFVFSILLIVIIKQFRMNWLVTFIPFIIIVLFFFIDANYTRFNSDYLGLDYRLDAIENIFLPSVFLFGKISGQSCGFDAQITLLTTIICKGGFFYFFLLLVILFFSHAFSSLAVLVFVSMILVSKIKLLYPFLWIYFVILFILVNLVLRQGINKKN